MPGLTFRYSAPTEIGLALHLQHQRGGSPLQTQAGFSPASMRRVEAASISTAAQPLDGAQLVPAGRRLGEPRSSSSGSSRVDHRNHANRVPSSLGWSRATAASMPAGRSLVGAQGDGPRRPESQDFCGFWAVHLLPVCRTRV
jgi:hypothetical protein